MNPVIKPSKLSLNPLAREATGETKTIQQWTVTFLISLGDFLGKNPLRYRGYGPYWWLVKKALIEYGITKFGDHLDAELIEAFDLGETAYNLLAAFAYSEQTFDMGQMTECTHTIDFEDGESQDYVLADDDMELLALSR